MGVKLLSKLGRGEKGQIVKIRGAVGLHRLLFDLGLFVGRTIAVEKTSLTPVGDPIEVRVNSSVISLDKEVASSIQVKVS